jgi:peptide/nickel transport system permease protein
LSRRGLGLYVVRRLLALVLLVVVISFVVFSLLYLAPGSPEQILLGARPATPETIAAIREQYHLNDSFFGQYWEWARGAARFDFGRSIRTNEPVAGAIGERFKLTLQLGGLAFFMTIVAGIPLGVLAAVRKRTSIDRGIVAVGVVGVSAPAFATGILLLYLFAVRLGWFPVFGEGTGVVDRIRHLALPAFALALTGIGLLVKLTRTAVIGALDQDYVTFARARGIRRRRVLWAYGLRNGLVPIVTAAGLLLAYMLAGTVLVEVTFALPGLGSLLVDSVRTLDIPVVQALAILIATIVVLVNLLADLAYIAIDPRIGFGKARA